MDNDDDDMHFLPWATHMAIRCVIGFYIVLAMLLLLAAPWL